MFSDGDLYERAFDGLVGEIADAGFDELRGNGNSTVRDSSRP